MIHKYLYNLLLIFILTIFYSCSSGDKVKNLKPKKIISLEKLYTEAYRNFEIGDYNQAIKIFEIVEKDYSYTEWAPRALLMRAYMYYDAGDYVAALTHLQRFKQRNSGSKNLQYVEYLIGICMFEQINYISLTQ